MGFIAVAWTVAWMLRQILKLFIGTRSGTRFQFWAKQGVSLVVAAILILGVMSIWFDNPARLASVRRAGRRRHRLRAAAGDHRGRGLFRDPARQDLQRRRPDPDGRRPRRRHRPDLHADADHGDGPIAAGKEDRPAIWVHSRQFTGRIVTVTNDKVFDKPVYNYTHEFAYIWDEISVPVHLHQDLRRPTGSSLTRPGSTRRPPSGLGADEVKRMEDRFGIEAGAISPRVFWRITENWLEMTVRFLGPDHGIREIKDQITREIIEKSTSSRHCDRGE